MTVSTNTDVQGELREAADRLLVEAMRYFTVYHKAGLSGAVVWVQDTDGRMVVLTRGEYRHTLMANIDRLQRESEDIFSFDAAGVQNTDGGQQ